MATAPTRDVAAQQPADGWAEIVELAAQVVEDVERRLQDGWTPSDAAKQEIHEAIRMAERSIRMAERSLRPRPFASGFRRAHAAILQCTRMRVQQRNMRGRAPRAQRRGTGRRATARSPGSLDEPSPLAARAASLALGGAV
jgi:hypothetical protein